MYDPQLGRFHTQDRFAEKYDDMSPYQYTMNNPILFVDINGDSTYSYNIATGQLSMINDVGGNEQQIVYFVNEDGSVIMLNDEEMATAIIDGENAYVTQASDGYLVSAYNPTADLPEGYNSNSGYEYSCADLIARHNLSEDGVMRRQINKWESKGEAHTISGKDGYREYVDKWGSNSAFYYGLDHPAFMPGPVELGEAGYNVTRSFTPKVRTYNPIFHSRYKNKWNAFQATHKYKNSTEASKEYQKLMHGK
jgi:hypothetical protein